MDASPSGIDAQRVQNGPANVRDEQSVESRLQPASNNDAGPEETLWSARSDWRHFSGRPAIYLFASFLVLIVVLAWWPDAWTWVGGLILIFAAFLAARITITILSTKYHLTTERLFIERGLIRTTKDQTELVRVDDVRIRRLLIDRIFNLGTVEVMSTDMTDRNVEVIGIADPDRVAELIRSRMRTARKKSLFVENL